MVDFEGVFVREESGGSSEGCRLRGDWFSMSEEIAFGHFSPERL